MTDWIMIIITFIYVIATIFICIYNYRSANAAREQVEEMRNQYKNDLRINMMPCLLIKSIPKTKSVNGIINIDFSYRDDKNDKIQKNIYFKIYNIGHDIAKEVVYYFEPCVNDDKRYSIISLPVNDFRIVKMCFFHNSNFDNRENCTKSVCMHIEYKDLFDNKYTQTLTVHLGINHSKMEMETYYLSAPKLIKD